ncbi:hypothetical protein Plhal304r1_c024g0081751 [Plasmopara halstedii]
MTIFFVSALDSQSNHRSNYYATEVFFSHAFDQSYALRQCSRSCFANTFASSARSQDLYTFNFNSFATTF